METSVVADDICEVEYNDIQRRGRCNIITSIFAHTGSQLFNYWLTPLHYRLVIQDARPTIVDAPLTLIFRR